MISHPVLEFSFKSLSNDVLPLLSCLGSILQSVERCLGRRGVELFNSNEKTALKLQVRASSPENYGPQFLHFLIRANHRTNPIITVRNLMIAVRKFYPEVIFI
jgi:hypothetical protein